jgi:transcriptional regulator with GAF, ATPase, and Fis domain
MNPRLVAISGPLKGTVLNLTQDEMTIGRLSGNGVSIPDMALSRRHCAIKREAEGFLISDLDSRNGSFVNGIPVKNRPLEHGDQIEIGDSTLLFLLQEGEVQLPSAPVQLANREVMTPTAVPVLVNDDLLQQTQEIRTATAARTTRDLDVLLRISATINSIRSLDALQRRLLEIIFEVIPAERGAILLTGEGAEEFDSIFGLSKVPGSDRPVQVSRTIVRQVLQEHVSVLSNNVLESEAFSTAKSLVTSRITSLLAVPLLLFEKIIGVIYLDTSNLAVRFDQDHLQLLTGIASIAAVALETARHVEWLESENRRLLGEVRIEHNMVGESAKMAAIFQFVAKVAPSDSTVLIRGESGTGKELVARALHLNGPRAAKPFVAINCATLTELLESELFGHEKGAFTGAIAQKKGKLEVADTGTVFLDEISELSPSLQAKLLRVLQLREFERVGGTRSIKVDIRLLAASNKALEEAIREGTFREDLYYRLNVISLTLPPLRERREDISLLASYFAAKYSRKCKRHVMGISPEARACLTRYDWPGNVRELENAIERAVVLGSGELILPEDLPEAVLEAEPGPEAHLTQYHEAVKETKKKLIFEAVEQANGNYTAAAKLLGLHPNYLHRLIRNLKLKPSLKK